MILCWRRHGKAGGCRIPLKTIRWIRFEIERTHRNGWIICDEDVLTYTSREVLFHITGFYQWLVNLSLSSLLMTDKVQSDMYLENCIHENLIQSSNRKVWNKYQDIRGVTRKCNQTNQKQAIINCKHHKPKMQRYASERNTVPAVWINWLS